MSITRITMATNMDTHCLDCRAFSDFIQQQKIKQDIGVSITQLDDGKAIPMENVMRDIQAKYE